MGRLPWPLPLAQSLALQFSGCPAQGGTGVDQASGGEEPLVPLCDGVFRVGEEERCPERIRFDTILNAQAVHANLPCGEHYGIFTP